MIQSEIHTFTVDEPAELDPIQRYAIDLVAGGAESHAEDDTNEDGELSDDDIEDRCARCHGPNIPWSSPSPLWNQVMRGGDINGHEIHQGIVCPTCFALLAEASGIASLWRFFAERVHVPLQTVTPSGRVWDESTWMWVEPDGEREAALPTHITNAQLLAACHALGIDPNETRAFLINVSSGNVYVTQHHRIDGKLLRVGDDVPSKTTTIPVREDAPSQDGDA